MLKVSAYLDFIINVDILALVGPELRSSADNVICSVKHLPEWGYVRSSKMTAGDVRRDLLHSHAIVLQAPGVVGRLTAAHIESFEAEQQREGWVKPAGQQKTN